MGKIEKEKQVVKIMIEIHCRKKHKSKVLCGDCAELLDYANLRADKCQFKENKMFCSNCKVHCYKPNMKEKIRGVMRFSGPRMILYHPIIAVKHLIETKRGR